MKKYLMIAAALAGFTACNTGTNEESEAPAKKLPIYGERYLDEETKDSVYHRIPDFELTSQDGKQITQKDFEGKIIIADFFFTSCETICPRMTSQLKRVAKRIEGMPDVFIVSHTVDPETDTQEVLKQYAETNGINTAKWWFLTGDETFIHEHGGQGYLLNVMKDSTAQGGFLHSEMFVLVDKDRRIRGIYNGTETADVDRLMNELIILNDEYGNNTAAAH